MVNEECLALLTRLKSSPLPLSGASLAREFGVSRVALWKRFEVLRAAGYPVEADRSGYRLGPGDKPLPWEFPGDEGRVFHFDSLESTMDEAMRRGLAGLPEGAVVAEHQTRGRGRADRSWSSAGGDLLVTLVVRPDLPASYLGALGLEALTCLAESLENLYGLDLDLKWPNDLLHEGRKAAGVLVEAFGPADRPRFYTVGLGLNVHGLPEVGRAAASVGELAPGADRRAILSDWRRRLAAWTAVPRPDPLRWRSRSRFPDRITVETFEGRTLSGRPLGMDRTGGLLLDCGDETQPIRYGETRRTQGVSG